MSAAPSGVVFDVQRYAVHDGPGIRTLVFLKGCPLRCAWCCNPESQEGGLQLRHVRARCRAWGRCVAACQHHAAVLTPRGLVLDRTVCAACADHACATACPEGALRVVGRRVTADEIVASVARDLPFYRNSGGGVTFSGGEPFAQPEFLLALLTGCRGLGIQTAVETCGWAEPRDVDASVALVDRFLFDVKVIDPNRHANATGVDNRLILANLERLAAHAGERIVLRLPLVPGTTDDDANIDAVGDLARRLGIAAVEVEPYHALGRDKYADLGLAEAIDPPPPDRAAIERVLTRLRGRGLEAALA